jgi:uncharacterized iron-regulated membrane protein
MKGIQLNKLHRYVGITLAPFLVIQALSGILLKFGLFNKGKGGEMGGLLSPTGNFDHLLVKIHFGPGLVNGIYHILVALAILWMAVTGWLLYLRIRKAQKRMTKTHAAGGGI